MHNLTSAHLRHVPARPDLWSILLKCAPALLLALNLTAQPQPSSTTTGAAPSRAPIFTFATGDAIRIAVYPEFDRFPAGIYVIDDQGYADLPLVGPIRVVDKTSTELENILSQHFIDYLPRPTLQVRPLMRVSLQGGFREPGFYWVEPRDNLWTVVKMAGGTLREDGPRKLRWERNHEIISKNLVPQLQTGAPLTTIGFRSGDQIWVTSRPKQYFWEVFRADVLPLMTMFISAATSAAMVYVTYQTYQGLR